MVDGGECPKDLTNCRDHKWELRAELSDKGKGLKSVFLRHGDGTLIYGALNASVVDVKYQATCCTQAVDMRVVDKAGNEGRCYHSVVSSAGRRTLSLWLSVLAAVLVATL